MTIGVIDVLEVVEIEKDHAELVTEASGAIDLSLERFIKMTGVVEAGAIVSDGEFLDLLHRAGVVNGDSGVVTERVQEEHLLLAKALHGAVDELDHSQNAVLGLQRNADDRPGLPLGHLIDALGKAGVIVNIGDDQRLAMSGHPASDPLPYLQTNRLERFGRITYGNCEIELVLLFIDHEEGPGVRTEEFRHLIHDGLQN